MARHEGRSEPAPKPVQLYARLWFRPLVHQADNIGQGNFKVFLFLAAAAAFVYIFYTLSATRVLNSFEELCITLAAAGNSFARELNPHGGAYIVIHRQTASLHHILIYMYKQESTLNNLQCLICHKTKPNQIIYI